MPASVTETRFVFPRGMNEPPDAHLRWRTCAIRADDLQEIQFKPLRFLVPGLVPEGTTLLVSRPKLGKSWLVLDLCIAIASGGRTLGGTTPPAGNVLYLALEDGWRRMQRRIARLIPDQAARWPKHLTLATQWARADEGGLDDIRNWCNNVDTPVAVVVDTLERFRARTGTTAGAYQLYHEAVAQLQRIAIEHQIAVVIVHHERKTSAEDPFQSMAGALSLSGAADTVLMLRREERGAVLYGRGRDVDDSETLMVFDRASCKWLPCGPAGVPLGSQERAMVRALLAQAAAPMTIRAIAEAAGGAMSSTRALLHRMVVDREIIRVSRGRFAGPSNANKPHSVVVP